jgi:hypothetical protein
MRRFIWGTLFVCLVVSIDSVFALDTESYDYIDRLLSIKEATGPAVYDDAVIFTAPSTYRKVGVAFANEDFATVHWFKNLMVPVGDLPPYNPKAKVQPSRYHDSGVLFFTYQIPENSDAIEYRLIINGLWTTDPLNPDARFDSESGLARSVVKLPPIERRRVSTQMPEGAVVFYYKAAPGKTISVTGTFNNWDPFMYRMHEEESGKYTLTLTLPPGSYHYDFYEDGQFIPDPANRDRVYYDSGRVAGVITVK